MKKFIPLIALLLLFSGCNKNKVFYKNVKLDQMIWHDGEIIPFQVKIDDTSSKYNIYFELRYYYGITFDKLPVRVITQSDGKIQTDNFTIQLKDEKGKPIGNASGDLTDLSVCIYKNIQFPKKKVYNIILQHGVTAMDLPGIIEAGLKVEKVK